MNYIALRLMLADAPRYVKKKGGSGGGRKKGGTLSGYFQSKLKKQNKQ